MNPEAEGYTVPADDPVSRIDFIFYLNTGSAEIDSSRVVMDEPYAENLYCSDHLAVITVFLLR